MTFKVLANMLVEDNFESWKKLLQNEEVRQFVLSLSEEIECPQIAKIREGFEEGLTVEQVKIYAKREITEYGMHSFKEMLKVYDKERVEMLAKKAIPKCEELSDEQIKTILKYGSTLPKETMLKYADSKLSPSKLAIIYQALTEGISEEAVDLITYPGLLVSEVEELMITIRQGISVERLKLCINPRINNNQMMIILRGIEAGDSLQQVKFYADGELSWQEMQEIRKVFKSRRKSFAIDFIVNNYVDCPKELKMLLIRAIAENKKINQIQLERIADYYDWDTSPNKIIIDILKK